MSATFKLVARPFLFGNLLDIRLLVSLNLPL